MTCANLELPTFVCLFFPRKYRFAVEMNVKMMNTKEKRKKIGPKNVEIRGVEPRASRTLVEPRLHVELNMRSERSTTELHPQR